MNRRTWSFTLLVLCLVLTSLVLAGLPAGAQDRDPKVEAWLAHQAQVKTWTAEVTQIRTLKSLARPLETKGKVWFAQPNRFRWQLGDPPRTIAVRAEDELRVAYPRLRQLEKYPMSGDLDASWKQVLALLEIGFPSDPDAFYESYEVVSVTPAGESWSLELRPAAKEARRLIELLRLEISEASSDLLSTELEFPDGSTLRNDFSGHVTNPDIDESLFELEPGEDWEVVLPLAGKG